MNLEKATDTLLFAKNWDITFGSLFSHLFSAKYRSEEPYREKDGFWAEVSTYDDDDDDDWMTDEAMRMIVKGYLPARSRWMTLDVIMSHGKASRTDGRMEGRIETWPYTRLYQF